MPQAPRLSPRLVPQRIRSIPASHSTDFVSPRQTTHLLAPARRVSILQPTLLRLYRVAALRSRLRQLFGFQSRPHPTLSGNPLSLISPSRPTESHAAVHDIFPPQFLHPPFSPAL